MTVLVLDVAVLWPTVWGPALVPFFCAAAGLVMAVAFALLTLAAETSVRLRALVRPCPYPVARRWYLAVADVVVLGLAVAAVLTRPVLGVLVPCSPPLYAAWATTRYVVAPLLRNR
ncbi:hypothetical protein ACIBP6_21405 [Nonomuraea terrae]|uniref:hypothetical protein n=1 Tax=Nonomuraea terrae TaxID=2530383 RepID=UPI0037B7F8CF